MTVKDCKHDEYHKWIDPSMWRDRLPREIAIYERIKQQGGHRNIHRYRGYRLNMKQHRWRLYTDLCKYRSITGAEDYIFEDISQFWKIRRNEWQRVSDQGEWDERRFPLDRDNMTLLPERFLWHIFRELVNGCGFLERGNGRGHGDGALEWRPIVHMDMYQGNVFLTASDENLFGEKAVTVEGSEETEVDAADRKIRWPRKAHLDERGDELRKEPTEKKGMAPFPNDVRALDLIKSLYETQLY